MFGPAVWLVGSSFKTPAQLAEFPPTLLPYVNEQVTVEGYDKPLTLYNVTIARRFDAGNWPRSAASASSRRWSTRNNPTEIVKVNIADREPVREIGFATENYIEPLRKNDFLLYLRNSVFVTAMATLITLLTNSMAAFALSKYKFRGREFVLLLIVGTLMVPLSVVSGAALFGGHRGRPVQFTVGRDPANGGDTDRRVPVAPVHADHPRRTDRRGAHGQCLRMADLLAHHPAADGACLAVLAIFSVVWRWNDFLWPLVVLSRKELYTLQVGLNTYAGELNVQWHFILAMTVVTMIPVVLVFVFLQRFITAGIAGSGLK